MSIEQTPPLKAVFIDRDGVINDVVWRGRNFFVAGKRVEHTAPFTYAEFRLKPWIACALRVLHASGFLCFLVSNQPDIAYGMLPLAEHEKIMRSVSALGFDELLLCTHSRDHGCECRKPRTGLVTALMRRYAIDLDSSFVIGDTEADTGLARALGCSSILIDAAYNKHVASDFRAASLLQATALIRRLSYTQRKENAVSHTGYILEYLEQAERIAAALRGQSETIGRIIDLLFAAWQQRTNVFIVGNGGSAATATHLAADLMKTIVGRPGDRGIRALALVDNIPLVSAAVNDWGWNEVYQSQLETLWEPGSIVIALSVHGGSGSDQAGAWSQNLLRALQFAKDHNGTAIALAGFDGGAMKDLADLCVVVPAESTPHVESFHVVLHHLIAFRLKELLAHEACKTTASTEEIRA